MILGFGNHHLFNDIIISVRKLQKLFEELEESKIPSILKNVIKPSPHYYVTSILGLNEDAAEYVSKDDYYSTETLINEFLEKNEAEIQDSDSYRQAFEKLGFSPIKSKTLSELADANTYSNHESVAQFASRHIELQFKYNFLLNASGNIVKIPGVADSPLRTQYSIPTDSDNPNQSPKVNCINFSVDSDIKHEQHASLKSLHLRTL